MKLGKNVFISLQKLFSFSRKWNFRLLYIQILWRHQMPKHKRNTFSWITREVKTVCSWNLASLFYITKEKKIIKNFFKKLRPENRFKALLWLQRMKHNLYWKMKLLNRATYIKYVIAKLSKFVHTSMRTSSDLFLQRILWNCWKSKRACN